MALTSSVLAAGLQSLTPTDSEATARQRLTDAFESYFEGATVNGAALAPGSISAGLSAFQSALTGMSGADLGATKIAAAVSAFWSAQLNSPTTMWVTAPVVLVAPITPPPGLSSIQGGLESAFESNRDSSASLASACSSIAAAIHGGCTGGVVNGSVPPAAPAPIPIL